MKWFEKDGLEKELVKLIVKVVQRFLNPVCA